MKVLAILGLLGIVALKLQAQDTTTIEGVVVDSVTGAGIGGVAIQVLGNGSTILTNQAGKFLVTGLRPGDYLVSAEKQGYLEPVRRLFHVNTDGASVQPRLTLTPRAILRGRVVGPDGKPAKAVIELVGSGPRDSVIANEDGYFTFERLSPGSYTLLGRPEVVEPLVSQEGLRTEAAPTYYPSALERAQAESIAVRAGTELSGYEIRLQSAPVYRVSGVVLDLEGNPAPGAVVQILDKVADGFTSYTVGRQEFSIRPSALADTPGTTQSTTTAGDGTFEFPSVRPGDWTVRVESDSVRDEIQQRDIVLFGSTAISLGQRDLDDIAIHLVMPFDFSGTVEACDAPQSIAQSVGVTLTGTSGYFGGTARPDAKGTLRFEGVIPGRYLVTTTGVTGNYYASALVGSSDVTGQTAEITLSSPSMRVVLKHGGTVRWTLESSSSWSVLLMPRNLTGIGYQAFSLPNGVAASELSGIPPGEYYAIALDRFDSRTMADLTHLSELVPRATSVRIEEASDAFVALKINHAPD